jgi:glycine oxidase
MDVTIRGAGIFGLSIGWACAARGARVQVIDPHGIGAGSSGGIVGALSPHVPENWNDKKAFQLKSLLMAEDWWSRASVAGGGDPGYGRTGRLQPIPDAAALERARARSDGAASLWQGRAEWSVIWSEMAGAWAPPSDSGRLIHDTLSARINPRAALDCLARAIRARSGEIVEAGGDKGVVVWATGYHDLARMGVSGAGVKGQAALLRLDQREAPQLFVDGLHVVPHANGTVAIGSTSERDWAEPASTDEQLDALIDKARRLVPALAEAPVIERWAGIRPRSRSRAPLIGAHPLEPGAYIANGGFKIGFGMAPLIAEIMADLLLEGRDAIPDDFRPTD